MKRAHSLILGLIALLFAACSDSDLYDEMPAKIQTFVSQYYPNSPLESFLTSADYYTVIIKNGPTLTFNKQCQWTKLNGNGSTLPQVLLFNDLPPELYNYLQETENTDNVFVAERNNDYYTLTLLKSTLKYQISTGLITGQAEN